ncbi:MAG: hypothetical protein JW959_04940 [Pirellulales bacterium]|nr:hypothetical protein [Pirellulales bacterium]
MNKKTAPRKHGSAQSDKLDLCAICMYADECMYRSTAARPKIYCELFDVDTKAFAPREDGDPSLQNGGDQPLDLAGGLCCNCENRNVCTIRRKNGNVWHCEEYR